MTGAEAQLVAESASGFDAFASSAASTLFNLAYLLTGHRQTAEDLTQDALLMIYRHWSRVEDAEHPVAYAKRVLTNCHLSRVRRRRVREVGGLELRDVDPDSGTVDLTAGVDARDEMWSALSELSARQRAVLVLRYYEGMSDADIAVVLQWRPASVRSAATRALARLRTSTELFPSQLPTRREGAVGEPSPDSARRKP